MDGEKFVTLRLREMSWVLLRETLSCAAEGAPLDPHTCRELRKALDGIQELRASPLGVGDNVILPAPRAGDAWSQEGLTCVVADISEAGLVTVNSSAGATYVVAADRVRTTSAFVEEVEIGEEIVEIHRDPISHALFGVDGTWAEFNGIVNSPYNPHSIELEEPS